jgi:hypothetical protein
MFSTLCASLLLALVCSVLAIEVPPIQSLMLVGACLAATIFCCALEAWSSQETPAEIAPGSDAGRDGTN